MPNRVVRPIHFEDFSGSDFERLVYAYHLRAGWNELAWHGQTGSDQGRDIIGIEPFDDRPSQKTVIQCVNRTTLTLKKAEDDMAAAVAALTGRPDAFKFVCRGAVSSQRRDEVKSAARSLGVHSVTIWSGTEFEEALRLRAEFLLQRLIDGVAFPESEADIRDFANNVGTRTDEEALALITPIFDRPAFYTPFQHESSLPAFLSAIEDTIGALNTGVWRTRHGADIRRIPSIHQIRDSTLASKLGRISRGLDELRRFFKQGLVDGSIRPCGCGNPDCPTFLIDQDMVRRLNAARQQLLAQLHELRPSFSVQLT